MREKLEAFDRSLEHTNLRITHGTDMLSSFHQDFWVHCFVDLFYHGDCQERLSREYCKEGVPSGRPRYIPDYLWAKCLITRADFRGWRMNLEFVACMYNILLRRDQLKAVRLQISKITEDDAAKFAEATAYDIVTQAMASGECDTLREVLRKQKLVREIRDCVSNYAACTA